MKDQKRTGSRILLAAAALLLIAVCVLTVLYVHLLSSQNAGRTLAVNALQGLSHSEKGIVTGHKSPDTDTVASAVAYARLRRLMGENCEPAVTGKINNETRLVLDTFGVPVPPLLENAENCDLILVDHSALTQAPDGAERANILEILDHHSLGDVTTLSPLHMKVMPVGATATIVYLSYLEYGIQPDKSTAGLLASAILSDTRNLTSTTVSEADRQALKALLPLAGIQDQDAWFAQMDEAARAYYGMTDREILLSDYKEYDMSGTSVGIACLYADFAKDQDPCERVLAMMEEAFPDLNVAHLYAMLAFPAEDETVLLSFGQGAEQVALQAFSAGEDGRIVFTPQASRKKDVVPPLLNAYADQMTREMPGGQ